MVDGEPATAEEFYRDLQWMSAAELLALFPTLKGMDNECYDWLTCKVDPVFSVLIFHVAWPARYTAKYTAEAKEVPGYDTSNLQTPPHMPGAAARLHHHASPPPHLHRPQRIVHHPNHLPKRSPDLAGGVP